MIIDFGILLHCFLFLFVVWCAFIDLLSFAGTGVYGGRYNYLNTNFARSPDDGAPFSMKFGGDQVLRFEIGASQIAFQFLEDLLIQFR